jgi:hypothetical protein
MENSSIFEEEEMTVLQDERKGNETPIFIDTNEVYAESIACRTCGQLWQIINIGGQ